MGSVRDEIVALWRRVRIVANEGDTPLLDAVSSGIHRVAFYGDQYNFIASLTN